MAYCNIKSKKQGFTLSVSNLPTPPSHFRMKGYSFLTPGLPSHLSACENYKIKKKMQRHQNFEVTSKIKKFQFLVSSRLTYQRRIMQEHYSILNTWCGFERTIQPLAKLDY